jgi:protease PrsW
MWTATTARATSVAPQTRAVRRVAKPVRVGRHSWLAVLVLGVGLFVADEQALVSTSNPNFLPSILLLGAAVVPVAFVVYLYGRRLDYDIPTGPVWATALLAGALGTAVAGFLEFQTLHRLGVLPMTAVGAIEETAKLLVPAVVLLWMRYRIPADGLLLGVAAGAGFAAFETMGYAFVALLQSQGSLPAVTTLLLTRGLLSPAGHMAWSGVAAAALWSAACSGWTRAAVMKFLGALVAVVALHTAWDSIGTLPGYVVVAALSLGLLAYAVHRVGPRHQPANADAGAYPDAGRTDRRDERTRDHGTAIDRGER